MESVLLSNPIYQHSGETQKDNSIAQQASINEDQEQRRRQLDARGEKQKILIAKEVSHIVDEFGGNVHLKQTPIPAEPLLQQAQHATTNVLASAFEAGKNLFNSATTAATAAADRVITAGTTAAHNVTSATKQVADQAVHLGQDAAGYVQHVAQEAAHQASDISKIVVDSGYTAAVAVKEKTQELADVASNKAHELADVASNKAHELADNISHFTTLVAVLAEEENERARRLISGDEARAAANAFRVSELIRELDPCFYKQTPNLSYATKVLEEAERRWRLNSSHSSLAETNAHNVGKIVNRNLESFVPRHEWVRSHILTLEDKERTRRLNDANESFAMINAFALSGLIRNLGLGFYRQEGLFSKAHNSYATTLLEELERKNRIRQDKLTHAHDNAHLLSDIVATNVEKFSYTTRNAGKFANEFANMLGTATKSIANNFSVLTQEFAKNAATRVKSAAGDVVNYSTLLYVIALEERERARRLSDPDEIAAINNAWIQSGLIRELEGLYRAHSRAVFPLSLIEDQERRWRLSNIKPASSRKLADIVKPQAMKFELATQRMAKIEHAIDTAHHSKLNPNAPSFIPHMKISEKLTPNIPLAPAKAAGAQF